MMMIIIIDNKMIMMISTIILYQQPFLYLKHGRGCEQRWRSYFNFCAGATRRP